MDNKVLDELERLEAESRTDGPFQDYADLALRSLLWVHARDLIAAARQAPGPNAMQWCAAAHKAEAEVAELRKRCEELERENILQAATINGLRLPQTDWAGRTMEELELENTRLCRLLADAAAKGGGA